MGGVVNDRVYWFFRNGGALLLNILVMLPFLVMFAAEALYDGVRYTLECDGSTVLDWPWQMEWPFFRDDTDSNQNSDG